MPFIGDQGWFYLSARDMLLFGNIPLVGITSSHTWLHQGPLWTYILGVIFFLTKYNPLAPAYFTAFMGVVTVFVLYVVVSKIFSEKTGLICSFLYSASPLVIIHSRMPYHTSLIPLFSILFFYSIYRWIKGSKKYFLFSFLLLGILYNLELATQLLWFILLIVLFFGFLKKERSFKILSKSTWVYSLILFLIPMIPIFIYDYNNGFNQTAKFGGWIFYKIFNLILLRGSEINFLQSLDFISVYIGRILFLPSFIISVITLIGSLIWMAFEIRRKRNQSLILLALFIVSSIMGLFVSGPSEAYLPMVYPFIFIMLSLFIQSFIKKPFILTGVVLIIVFSNMYYLISQDYLMGKFSGYGPYFSERVDVVNQIIKRSNQKSFNLAGKGEGSQFASFTMNYEFLLWFKGHPISKENEKLKLIISEDKGKINLEEK